MKFLNFNPHFYFHPPVGGFKRGLRPDAVTGVIIENGVVTVKNREFFSLKTWAIHYTNEFKDLFKKKEIEFVNAVLKKIKIPVLVKTTAGNYVWLAIAFDALGVGQTGTYQNASWNHTVTATNPALVCCFTTSDNFTTVVSSITYNSVALSNKITSTNTRVASIYGLQAPASGTNALSFNFSVASHTTVANSISFSGASQSGAFGNTGSTFQGSPTTSVTGSITTANANSMVVDMCAGANVDGANFSVSPFTLAFNGANGGTRGSGSYSTFASAGSHSDTYSGIGGVTSTYEIVLLEIVQGLQNFTRSLSDSVTTGASRATTVARLVSFFRATADSIMNGVSRLVTVQKGTVFAITVNILNGASRLVTVSRLVSFFRAASVSMMNGASRLVIVGLGYARNLTDSIMNGASRSVTLARITGFIRAASASILNSASRLATVAAHLFIYAKGFILGVNKDTNTNYGTRKGQNLGTDKDTNTKMGTRL